MHRKALNVRKSGIKSTNLDLMRIINIYYGMCIRQSMAKDLTFLMLVMQWFMDCLHKISLQRFKAVEALFYCQSYIKSLITVILGRKKFDILLIMNNALLYRIIICWHAPQ